MNTDNRPAKTTQRLPMSTGKDGAASPPELSSADHLPVSMGNLEFGAYRDRWRASLRFRLWAEVVEADKRDRSVLHSEEVAFDPAKPRLRVGWKQLKQQRYNADRFSHCEDDEDDEIVTSNGSDRTDARAVSAGNVAASLLFARMIDSCPGLGAAIQGGAAPVVVVDVADSLALERVSRAWRDTLFDKSALLINIASEPVRYRGYLDALYLVATEPPKKASASSIESKALSILALALPTMAISPSGRTYLPEAINRAATHCLDFPRIDASTVLKVVRIVTGKACSARIEQEIVAHVSFAELEIAIRFDRTPEECYAELRRLVAAKATMKKARDLTLSQLHGLSKAREWAASAIADVESWKRGEIPWSAVASGVALTGPPGCGKTTFASVFAAEAGLTLVSATLAKWQSTGDAHLGHLLRAMRQDFDAARAQAPSCLFIDEIDSFPNRAGITHSHKDYVVEVVNALLAEIDGISGREGVVVIGCSNDISRCDPALLRAGRLEHLVEIGFPDISDLERMFRVRLGADLPNANLRYIAELTVGMTGADVERVVKDARRAARQEGNRVLVMDDLRKALVEDDNRPVEQRWRTCIHEAAHILVDVIYFGPDNVFARIAKMHGQFGMSARRHLSHLEGTALEYRKRIEVALAGRTAEELVFRAASHGSGGADGSDLDHATRLACAAIGSCGLSGPSPLLYLGPAQDAAGFLSFPEVRAAVRLELTEASRSCAKLLEANRGALEAAARQLATQGRIDGLEVASLIAKQSSMQGVSDARTWNDVSQVQTK